MFDASSFPEPTMVSVNGVELEVFEAGPRGGGEPIVLCHGWPEHAFSWRHQMAALAAAGHHVIVPNQRGYGRSSRPLEVTDYDVEHLAGDLVALLDHYGYDDATFMGHDWGAMVVWGLTMLHPQRVRQVINLSLPYQERGDQPWVEMIEALLGSDNYIVHFNREPDVAAAVFERNTERFLRHMLRKDQPLPEPGAAMGPIELATAEAAPGAPLLSEAELDVYVTAYETSGFSGGIGWYRNFDRNWHLLADVEPVIDQRALMIYGARDAVPQSPRLAEFVPDVEVVTLDAGHCVQQERPEETNRVVLQWLARGRGR